MPLPRFLLVVLGVLLALAFVGRMACGALASDEQLIRWRLEGMVDGFNATRSKPVLAGFTHRYEDEDSKTDFRGVREILTYLFFQEIDPETKKFRLRAEIPGESLVIEVGEDGKAELDGRLILHETKGGAEEVFWDTPFHATLRKERGGWAIARTVGAKHGERGSLR